jgi:hypothetical protein
VLGDHAGWTALPSPDSRSTGFSWDMLRQEDEEERGQRVYMAQVDTKDALHSRSPRVQSKPLPVPNTVSDTK